MELAAEAPWADGSYQVTSSFGRSVAVKDLKSNSSVALAEGGPSLVRPSCSPRPNGSLLPKHDRRAPSPTIGAYAGRADQSEALAGIHIHSPELVPARHSAIQLCPVPRAGIEGNLALDPKGGLPRDTACASAAGTGGNLSRDPGALRAHSGRTSGNWGPDARGRHSDSWPGEVADRLPGLDLGSTLETL